jgi:mitogen-activated protein kinase organizer 1
MTCLSLTAKFCGHEGPITTLHFSRECKYLLSSSQDSTIRVWSLQSVREVAKLQGHLSSVNSFVANQNDSVLFSGGCDNAICWWDVERGSLVRKLRCHNGAVNSVCFNEDSSVAISGSLDSLVKIWDCRRGGGSPIQTLSESKDSITAVASSRYEILTASVDGWLRIYDVRQSCLTVDSLGSRIVAIELSRDQQRILVSTLDSKVCLIVKPTGEEMQTYTGHTCQKYAVRAHFAANDAAVVSGSEAGEVVMWELVEATVEHRLPFGDGPILDIAVQRPFMAIAAGSANGEIGLFRKSETG